MLLARSTYTWQTSVRLIHQTRKTSENLHNQLIKSTFCVLSLFFIYIILAKGVWCFLGISTASWPEGSNSELVSGRLSVHLRGALEQGLDPRCTSGAAQWPAGQTVVVLGRLPENLKLCDSAGYARLMLHFKVLITLTDFLTYWLSS